MRLKLLPLILISCSILLINCKGKNEGVQIYNPTENEMKVQINDTSYTIEANGLLDINVEAGEIAIQSFIGDAQMVDTVIKINSKMIKGGVLLNASGESLYKLDEIYGAPSFSTIINDIYYLEDSIVEKMDNQFMIDDYVAFKTGAPSINTKTYNSILVDNYIIVGKIDTYLPNQVVISLDWDYGPNTPYPDEIEVEDNATNNTFGVYKSKIFSAYELIQYYYGTYSYDMEGYEESLGDYEFDY